MSKILTVGKLLGIVFCILAAACTVVLLCVNAYFGGQMKLADKLYTALERDDFDSYQDCFWDAIKSDITYEDSFLYVKDSISILQDNEKLHTKLEFVDRQKYTNDSYDVTFNLTIYNDEEHIELENQIMTMRRDKGKWVICP